MIDNPFPPKTPDPFHVQRQQFVSRPFLLATIALIWLALCAAELWGQPARPVVQEVVPTPAPAAFTLDELTALAEQTSPQLAAAAAQIDAASGRALQAGLYPNPVLSGGAMQLGGRESQYYGQLSQEIVTRHKLRLNRQAACQEVTQAELQFVQTRFELLTSVRQGFATALAAQERLIVLEELVNLARKSHRTAAQLVEAGEAPKQDSILFDIELEKAEMNLENARTQDQQARRRLAAVMGQRTLIIGRVAGNLAQPMDRLAAELLIDDLVPRNAAIGIAEVEIERARLLARRAEVEPFPNITFGAGYMYQVEGQHNMGIVDLSLPLPLWNKNQGNIVAARAGVGRAFAAVEQQQNTLAQQMADAIARFRVADQQVARYEKQIIPKAREGVRIIQLGFDRGQFDFQRLLQAQRSLVEADLSYVAALEARWQAAAELAGLAQVEVFP
jgi:cobalt-zinc-cadmium efflux system outer membrane protein